MLPGIELEESRFLFLDSISYRALYFLYQNNRENLKSANWIAILS